MLEGRFDYPDDQLPLDHFRTYRLCRLLHVVPSALEDESAITLDWLLAVDRTYREAEAEVARRESEA